MDIAWLPLWIFKKKLGTSWILARVSFRFARKLITQFHSLDSSLEVHWTRNLVSPASNLNLCEILLWGSASHIIFNSKNKPHYEVAHGQDSVLSRHCEKQICGLHVPRQLHQSFSCEQKYKSQLPSTWEFWNAPLGEIAWASCEKKLYFSYRSVTVVDLPKKY